MSFEGEMLLNWNQKELEALFQKAKKKAMEDEAFRKEITENLKAALEKLAGAALPDDVSLKLIEKSADFARIFTCTDIDLDELEPAALEKVQGGNDQCGINSCRFYNGEPCYAYFCAADYCDSYVRCPAETYSACPVLCTAYEAYDCAGAVCGAHFE